MRFRFRWSDILDAAEHSEDSQDSKDLQNSEDPTIDDQPGDREDNQSEVKQIGLVAEVSRPDSEGYDLDYSLPSEEHYEAKLCVVQEVLQPNTT